MYVYPMMKGGMLIINPMIVNEAVLKQILQLGNPTVLAILCDDQFCPVHTKDVAAWRKKFPESVFACPNKHYQRLVKDIPLVEFLDTTLEMQIKYEDVSVRFPCDDRSELHMLLTVKDGKANTEEENRALVVGEMLHGDNSDPKNIHETTIGRVMSTMFKQRAQIGGHFARMAENEHLMGILPSHGLPLVESADASSSSSSSSSLPRQNIGVAKETLLKIAATYPKEKPKDSKKSQ
eukprot:MONOS_3461.1-p1 / transcript=MONOS_3461.1 / gene=MONOS_3461 / organism=Monocercomonoides_exilis_PA203 / gene_product=unspecified product / transcript_product=unspecified product / location=Mono_scaffold00082:12385-13350(-) / protein_length=236 / sequence_SO=supercontig / SO=protein_coding / is_pseudo=false